MTQTRTCASCGITKDLETCYYRRNKAYAGIDGYLVKCKECIKVAKRKPRVCAGCGESYYFEGSFGAKRRTCDKCAEAGRVCPRCNEFKPLDRFYTQGRNAYCKDGCALWANRKSRYGVSIQGSALLEAEHAGACPICKRSGRRMAVDHNHETGKVRGLICGSCNSGLGLFGDNADFLRGAIEYLARHQ